MGRALIFRSQPYVAFKDKRHLQPQSAQGPHESQEEPPAAWYQWCGCTNSFVTYNPKAATRTVEKPSEDRADQTYHPHPCPRTLNQIPYPDCPICFSSIRPDHVIRACAPSPLARKVKAGRKGVQIPGGYWCFCHAQQEPQSRRLVTPHSCNFCLRLRESRCAIAV